ncbi:hypothetical protein H4219_005180 [Mycoemilia scoparia]|uniref:Phosphotransferase n=1 Tax=Mycoemilia scoparia TaxID=417184 RepID=A0A9W7ZYL6_9FUNG|nr:hypothetical protein H4219_005180 [Mycoemilia scoparia]
MNSIKDLSESQIAFIENVKEEFELPLDRLVQTTIRLQKSKESCSPRYPHKTNLRVPNFHNRNVYLSPPHSHYYLGISISNAGRECRLSCLQKRKDGSTQEIKSVVPIESSNTNYVECIVDGLDCFLSNNNIEPTTIQPVLPLSLSICYPVSNTESDCSDPCDSNISCNGCKERTNLPYDRSQDLARYLNDALIRTNMPVRLTSICNNAEAILTASNHQNNNQVMATVVLNSGINVAYFAPQSDDETNSKDGRAMVNTEVGNFGNDSHVLPCTRWDQSLLRESARPNERHLEKLIGGQYLGELVRIVLLDSIDQGLLPSIKSPIFELDIPYNFHTDYMGEIINDESSGLYTIRSMFKNTFQVLDLSTADALVVKSICQLVTVRAAKLSGCVMAFASLQAYISANTSSKTNNDVGAELKRPTTINLCGHVFDLNDTFLNVAQATMRAILENLDASPVNVIKNSPSSAVLGAALLSVYAP